MTTYLNTADGSNVTPQRNFASHSYDGWHYGTRQDGHESTDHGETRRGLLNYERQAEPPLAGLQEKLDTPHPFFALRTGDASVCQYSLG